MCRQLIHVYTNVNICGLYVRNVFLPACIYITCVYLHLAWILMCMCIFRTIDEVSIDNKLLSFQSFDFNLRMQSLLGPVLSSYTQVGYLLCPSCSRYHMLVSNYPRPLPSLHVPEITTVCFWFWVKMYILFPFFLKCHVLHTIDIR